MATQREGQGQGETVFPPLPCTKYKWRNLIEGLFNKLKNWRRVTTRYDKTKESYVGFVALASVKLWIPFVHET